MSSVATTAPSIKFEARGAVADVFKCRDLEVLIHGPAGTGKSRGILEKLHLAMTKYNGARGLLVRKTRSSLTSTGIVTYEKEVLVPGDRVEFHTPSQSYRYPNKSTITVGGLDDSMKIMSSQYDIIVVLEATELVEDDWQDLKTRLRNPVMPYHQIIADCNPGSPSHWLWRKVLSGEVTAFASKHENNPYLYNAVTNKWTKEGAAYKKVLESLSGIRYKRLTKGEWCSAEGAVYDLFNHNVHVIPRFEIPSSWSRYWCLDFGFTHPFVCGIWAEDPDGRLYLYREIYRTQRTVVQHCMRLKSLNEPRPRAVICDHDAEDRATFENEMGMRTVEARKEITTGLQAVTDRLRIAGDGKPRIYFFKDAIIEKDANLDSKKLPTCTVDEFDSYVWDDSTENKKELPIKKFDHGMDQMRYTVMHIDKKIRFKSRIVALN